MRGRRAGGPATRALELVAPARLGASFRWLIGSSWLSNLGDGIDLSAAPLLVAAQTHDPFLVALAVVLQRLPWVLAAPMAGVVADRVDRRRIVVAVQTSRAALLAALTLVVLSDEIDVPVVLVATFVIGVTEVFGDVTASTL